MDLFDYLADRKAVISSFIKQYLNEIRLDPILETKQHVHAFERLKEFSVRGKMIRGSLVTLGYNLFYEEVNLENLTILGAAMELLQSALLIHDDIMDQDTQRRGASTLYHQYVQECTRLQKMNPLHTGQSLGICVGDLAIFLGFDLLYRLTGSVEIQQRLGRLFTREMLIVGTAQMDDVAWGAERALPGEEEVLQLYRHKTGRYTFSLPLCIGAMMADQPETQCQQLMTLGENMGILFQIRDDELGLLGDEKKIGKPVGSDIREGKKTLHYLELLKHCSSGESESLRSVFGNENADDDEINRVLDLIRKYNIPHILQQRFHSLSVETEAMILENSSFRKDAQNLLLQAFKYSSQRVF